MIFLIYTAESIGLTFFITAGTFGAMCIYGATTKRDLTSMGNLLFMALFGLILASVVNIFWHSSGLYWVVTYAGILIFVGLTAYDAQKIKRMHATGMEGTEEDRKAAVLGALAYIWTSSTSSSYYFASLAGRSRGWQRRPSSSVELSVPQFSSARSLPPPSNKRYGRGSAILEVSSSSTTTISPLM